MTVTARDSGHSAHAGFHTAGHRLCWTVTVEQSLSTTMTGTVTIILGVLAYSLSTSASARHGSSSQTGAGAAYSQAVQL